MANLRHKRKFGANARDSQGEMPGNSQSQNSAFPRVNEEYNKVSEEIEGMVTKKLSQEFKRTKSRILGALSTLDKFLRIHKSGCNLEPFREHAGA